MQSGMDGLQSEQVFFLWKGRVALFAILKACGVCDGDRVVLPGYTCIVVPNAVQYCGAKPLYADIRREDYNMDVIKLEAQLESLPPEEKKKIKAFIVQHTYGIPADMNALMALAKKYDAHVIEDCAHALGSLYMGRPVGRIGDASFFSFQWQKPVSCGLGGMALVNNASLIPAMKEVMKGFSSPTQKDVARLKMEYFVYKRLMTPRVFWFGIELYRKLSSAGILTGSSSRGELDGLKPPGFEKRMSHWQRAVVERELQDLNDKTRRRERILQCYTEGLNFPSDRTFTASSDTQTVLLRYPVLVADKDRVLCEAQKQRVELGDWFVSPVHPNMSGWEKEGYEKGSCPVAEEMCRRVINLPLHPKITEQEADRIVSFVKSVA